MLTSLKDGYRVLVVGATGGIGHALCEQLRKDERCAELIALSRKSVPAVDYADEASLLDAARFLAEKNTELDAILIATGILDAPDESPPEKSFRQFEAGPSEAVFRVNAIGPALVLKHFSPLLRRKGKSIVMALSARVGSVGDNHLGGWISYRASKAALNQIIHTAAIELSRRNSDSVCVAMHPGTIRTGLSKPHAKDRFTHSAEDCAVNLLSVLDRLNAAQTGGFFDYSGAEIPW